MAGIVTLFGIIAVTFLYCRAFEKKTEEYCCVTLFLTVAVLYPFYCMDLLPVGRYVVYILTLAITLLSIYRIIKKLNFHNKNTLKLLLPTPGICIFAVIIIFFVFYLRDNRAELWDELRLWAAAPKALHSTETLQMGESALLFPDMQSYPPAMPLLVYFITALEPEFPEYQIFLVYAVFFSALVLPALRDLKWRQWPLFALVSIAVILLPCVFTSHNCDYGRFYNSLYIDPVLGALAGYVLYLSTDHPFSNWLSAIRFGSSLVFLTLCKDSGILFALFFAVNAIVLYMVENNGKMNRMVALKVALSVFPCLSALAIWKSLLLFYNVSTDSSSHVNITSFPIAAIKQTIIQLLREPMMHLEGVTFTLQMAFVPCLIVMFAVFWLGMKNAKKHEKICELVTWCTIAITIAIFLIGNCLAFGEELPSYARYISALLISVLLFVILSRLPVLLNKLQYSEWIECIVQKIRLKSTNNRAMYMYTWVLISLIVVVLVGRYLDNWEFYYKYKIDPGEYTVVDFAVTQIRNNQTKNQNMDSDYYLIISDDMVLNSRIHHRIYFELLSSSAHVKNFYNDTNIIGGGTIPDEWSSSDVEAAAQQWSNKLLTEQYEYVHVVIKNNFTEEVMTYLGAGEVETGNTYAIAIENDRITLQICE